MFNEMEKWGVYVRFKSVKPFLPISSRCVYMKAQATALHQNIHKTSANQSGSTRYENVFPFKPFPWQGYVCCVPYVVNICHAVIISSKVLGSCVS